MRARTSLPEQGRQISASFTSLLLRQPLTLSAVLPHLWHTVLSGACTICKV
jgi:hypothetical protein